MNMECRCHEYVRTHPRRTAATYLCVDVCPVTQSYACAYLHVLPQITTRGSRVPAASLDELVDGGRAAKQAWVSAMKAEQDAQQKAQGWGKLTYKPRPSPHSQVCA
jgi:hypothetical protein